MLAAILPLPSRPTWRPRASEESYRVARVEHDTSAGAQPAQQQQTVDRDHRQQREASRQQPLNEKMTNEDLEATHDLFDALDVARWQKARWWRNLNRAMSVVGVLIVVAVVSLSLVNNVVRWCGGMATDGFQIACAAVAAR